MKRLDVTVAQGIREKRISLYLKEDMHLSSTLIKRVKYGGVFINGECVHMRATVSEGDTVTVLLEEKEKNEIKPKDIPLDIVYEDDYILAVNKPRTMPTHPSLGNSLPTLAEGVIAYLGEDTVFRAVGRLDRDTSGIVIIAKDAYTAGRLSSDMKRGLFKKEYLAELSSVPNPERGFIDAPIERECEGSIRRTVREDGKRALTEYEVIEKYENGRCLCRIILHTGRTHQIRVHMAHVGCPLYADFLYGNRIDGKTYTLHAHSISFPHPKDGKTIKLTAQLPK